MNKEWKFVIWTGALFLIMFLRNFSTWSQVEANDFVDILLYGYLVLAGISTIEIIYKTFRKPFSKKQDI